MRIKIRAYSAVTN